MHNPPTQVKSIIKKFKNIWKTLSLLMILLLLDATPVDMEDCATHTKRS